MMGINSASKYLKTKYSKDKLINGAVDTLITNFFIDVSEGRVRAKNVEDLNRLINISLMLKSMDSGDGDNKALLLDTLGLSEDDSLKELYSRMLIHLNTTNDEENRPKDGLF
ncbi:hypothetical protein [Anaerococcus sp. Marseille-P3625]|uniref:hypothetical protein n=1 Tax=Anaerococcus sp. Marseille-P3625 TaxID=1977277 RepID=UPI000C08085E|nr:hypothetical protein [Anaerococcus sp. Marseille-P3625]